MADEDDVGRCASTELVEGVDELLAQAESASNASSTGVPALCLARSKMPITEPPLLNSRPDTPKRLALPAPGFFTFTFE